MSRINFFLLLMVLVSALFLVHNQYESRRLFTALDKARAQARELELSRDRLEVARQAQATPLRVERLAKDSLQMRSISPAITQYIRSSAASMITEGVRQP
jgi:cell division protein FtsL